MMMRKSIRLKSALAVLAAAILTGCAGTRTVDKDTAAQDLSGSNFKAYAKRYLDEKGNPKYDKESLLDTLEAGKAFNDAGMWKLSQDAFEHAGSMMKWKADTVSTPEGVVNLVGTTLTNDTLGPYTGKIYQGGLIDYYQAMNSLMMGDEPKARVNFNRVAVRQENAVTQLQSFVKSTNQEITQISGEQGAQTAKQSLKEISPKTSEGLQDVPTGLTNAKIRNSAADFMSAIFRSTSSSTMADKSGGLPRDILKKAASGAATQGGANLINNLDRNLQQNKGTIKNKVIVLYEDGLGPTFSEFRIDLPLFLVSDKVTYTGIALPKFQQGKPAIGGLKITNVNDPTIIMTNINDLAGLEFNAAYNGIVAKAVISTIIKTAAQYAANTAIDKNVGNNNVMGSLLKLGTGAAQAALTRADTRSWINQPNTIQIAYFDRPQNGTLNITTMSGAPIANVKIPDDPNALIVIKATGSQGKPAIYTQGLPAMKEATEI